MLNFSFFRAHPIYNEIFIFCWVHPSSGEINFSLRFISGDLFKHLLWSLFQLVTWLFSEASSQKNLSKVPVLEHKTPTLPYDPKRKMMIVDDDRGDP